MLEHPETLARWARALPTVRTIEDDARQWRKTYRDVLERPRARDHQTASV